MGERTPIDEGGLGTDGKSRGLGAGTEGNWEGDEHRSVMRERIPGDGPHGFIGD